jgi:hypothetical protein
MPIDPWLMKRWGKITAFLAASFSLAFLLASPSCAQSEVFTKWMARYDAAHSFDAPSAMAVDGKGNTFVTGAACVDSKCADSESLTVRYDSNGKLIWRAFLSSKGNAANGVDIAVDSAGNAYVFSLLWQFKDSGNTVSNPEAAIAKYSPAGARQWVNFLAGTRGTTYTPVKLAVAPQGNVYLTLTASQGSTPVSNALAIKYDTNGKQIWSRQVSSTSQDSDSPVFIRLDAAENVYIALSDFFSSQLHNSLILKYDSNGNLLKSFGVNQLGTVAAFRVNAQGNSYVAGGGSPQPPSGAEDRVVAKFSSAGALDWLYDYGAPASQIPAPSGFVDLGVDSAGDVFAAQTLPGAIAANTGRDISVVKFNSGGRLEWTTRYNGHSDDSGFDQAVALAVNSMGESYVTGSSSNPALACCLAEFATIKYDTKGNQVWVERYNSPGPNGGSPVAIVLSRGDALVTGQSDGGASSTDWATIDYVQDGAKATPTNLSFGSQAEDTQSASRTVTLTNTAEIALSITAIEITGDFQFADNCPNTLVPGESCSLGVTFIPTALGARTGALTIHDNWAGSATDPQTVELTGNGTN